MTVIDIALAFYGFAGTTGSIASGISLVLQKVNNTTADELFKECFFRAVKRNSIRLSHFVEGNDPSRVAVDKPLFEKSFKEVKGFEITNLETLSKQEITDNLTGHLRDCIILPGHQLTKKELDNQISFILNDAFADFFQQLPLSDRALKEVLLQHILHETSKKKVQQKRHSEVIRLLEKLESHQLDISKKLAYLDPTLIQKESGRPEFKNPFRIVKAEEFDHNYPLLASLFRKPTNYDLICGPDNLIISGGRGCGKSMILKSLFAPTAIEIERRNKKNDNSSFKESGLTYFGVYVKLAKGYFDDWSPDINLTEDAATQLFQHSFNMTILKATIDTLTECNDKHQILNYSRDDEKHIAMEIGKLMGLGDDHISDFQDIKGICVSENRKIGDYLGALRLSQQAKYLGKYTYVHEFPQEFCKIIVDAIKELTGLRIYFLLDEFENLAEFQQTVVNTITKLRPSSLSIKISSRALGIKSRVDLQKEPIQSPRDYQVVPLDYDVNSSEYANLLIEISKERLKAEDCAETNIRELLSSTSHFFDIGLEHIEKYLSAYLKEHRGIEYEKLDMPQQKEWIHRLDVAITFRTNTTRKYPKAYAGFAAFVELSSGIISNFLELCKMAFYLAEASGHDIRNGTPIEPRIQNEAAYLLSSASLNWIPKNIPKTGPKIARLVSDLADVFKEKLLHHHSEPEAARIVITDPEMFDEQDNIELADIFDSAVRWSVFHSRDLSNVYLPKHKSDVRPNEYTLNRILAPTLKISPRPRWRTPFKVNELNDLIKTERRAKRRNYLVNKHSGKKAKKAQKKGSQNSLFDE